MSRIQIAPSVACRRSSLAGSLSSFDARFIRQRRTAAIQFLPNAALACMVAMIARECSEYNFGDSEFLMLFLLLMTLPYAAMTHD